MDRRGPAPARRWAAWLAQWAALAALYYLAIHLALRGRAGPPRDWIFALAGSGDWLAALLGAASFRLAAGAFAAASREAEDRRVLSRCLAGAPPQDGKRYAAAGRIAPLAAPLAAPLSGTACVAYRYRIGGGDDVRKPVIGAELVYARVRPTRRAGEAPLAFAGLALAPSGIATEPAGDVRLLGFPRLAGFPEAALDGDAAYARAAAYVAATPFEDIGEDEAEHLLVEPLSLAADADKLLRRDWRVAGRQEVEPRDRLAETLVPEGVEVCALGLFHAAEGGLAPDVSPQGRPLRLLRGDAATVAAALAREGRGRAALGLALLVVPHALLAALLLLAR